ncbi:hypothetical protein [Candidatus Formimonas warabiya]|uniref:DUF1640 domain-containing protein n=1 Tax=Formimonas warabiya TaxID=1761012 RepID=A0A3G1KQ10_FORW1|nr:hypothetical protein [Candidatus Formimonas warabiya]ATW24520.1 hypothetical protein DCMF_06760 [Candidatus Formimonas warabiya]
MTDRELLELLVDKVTGMEDRFETRFVSLENRMGSMETEMTGFRTEMTGFRTEMTGFRTEMKEFRKEVNDKLDNLQTQSDVIAIHVLKHTEILHKLTGRTA